jgi:hypothetical protein
MSVERRGNEMIGEAVESYLSAMKLSGNRRI